MRSYVVRLVDSELRAGRIAGQVEAVQTGSVHPVRDAEELVSVLLSTVTSAERSKDEGSSGWDRWKDCQDFEAAVREPGSR